MSAGPFSSGKPVGRDRAVVDTGEWSYDAIRRAHDAIEEVAVGELGLDVYPNQIEVITAEQMLDAYASIGMPLMYRHWSFGKRFAREELLYRKGAQALAYELVINSNPCVSYVMEENSLTMQALVIAHAAFGHNHFFKNNYLFKQWTRADDVIDQLAYAKKFIADCEERHGIDAVEATLDAAHALMSHGVNRYAPRQRPRPGDREKKLRARQAHEEAHFDDIWRTVPDVKREPKTKDGRGRIRGKREDRNELGLPEENILAFLERHAPKLADWQRELLRIVRLNAQYFYPQRQTKLMNEGCATFVHYEIMNRLYAKGLVSEGAMLEFLHMHSAVVAQPPFSSRRFGGINPYALGFHMMRDIQRIAIDPSEEDRDWFPDFAGSGDAMGELKAAWADYRDESFVLQYLSPATIRHFRLFSVFDEAEAPFMTVGSIHEESGYLELRRALARQYDLGYQEPEIQVSDANLKGSRRLVLTHRVRDGKVLEDKTANRVMRHVAQLWGYRVQLIEVDAVSGRTIGEHDALPMP